MWAHLLFLKQDVRVVIVHLALRWSVFYRREWSILHSQGAKNAKKAQQRKG